MAINEKIYGKDVILFVNKGGANWVTFAYGTTADIDVSCEMKEISTPFLGKWVKNKRGRYSWSASSGHLLAEGRQRTDIIDMIKAGDSILVCLGSVTATDSIRQVLGYEMDGRFGLKGYAIIRKVSITARKGDYATLSIELDGNGKLEEI